MVYLGLQFTDSLPQSWYISCVIYRMNPPPFPHHNTVKQQPTVHGRDITQDLSDLCGEAGQRTSLVGSGSKALKPHDSHILDERHCFKLFWFVFVFTVFHWHDCFALFYSKDSIVFLHINCFAFLSVSFATLEESRLTEYLQCEGLFHERSVVDSSVVLRDFLQ